MKNKHCDGKDFEFLIGKSIIKVNKKQGKYQEDIFELTCDDETIIIIKTNKGCVVVVMVGHLLKI